MVLALDFSTVRVDIKDRGENEISSGLLPGSRLSMAGRCRSRDLYGFIGVEIKGGFSAVQKLLSPFNLSNLVVTLITLAPGIGLLIIADILRQKIKSKRFF